MASSENPVIIPADDNLGDRSSVEFVTIDEMEEQDESVQQQIPSDAAGMSYTTIPVEVLEAAGIDLENSGELTEEQMNTIMSLIGPSGTDQPDLKQHEQTATQSPYGCDMPNVASPETSDRLTLYVLDDGSLKLTDALLQKEYFFSSEELASQNIDVDNLTNESLQRIIQMAMEPDDAVVTKKRKMEEDGISAESSKASTSMELPATAAPKKTHVTDEQHDEQQQSLIGTEVELKRDGKVFLATIRYCRQAPSGCSTSYKVQFSDGHFEWINEDELHLLGGESLKKPSVHEPYSEATENVPLGSMARSATTSKNVSGRKCTSQIPGIKVTPADGFHKQEEPNFCCAICDRKVYQKEPQYMVIRIPACDSCVVQKMVVLENAKDCETQTCSTAEESDSHNDAGKDEKS